MSMSTESSAAAARAWEAYTMINSTAKNDVVRHTALTRFVEERSAANGLSAGALAVEGVKFLKRLEVG
jgi:hypothetical protein